MAAPSRYFEQEWTYNPNGNTHNDRIGRILVSGVNLSATMKQAASQNVTTALEFEKQMLAKTKKEKGFKIKEHPDGSASGSVSGDHYASTSSQQGGGTGGEASSRTGTRAADGRGMSWVNANTLEDLGPVVEAQQEAPPPAVGKLASLNSKQLAVATLTPTERTMGMWKKVNPGVTASVTRMPTSTMKDHFVDRHQELPGSRKEHNYKKTDFSEYVEASIRSMKQITS